MNDEKVTDIILSLSNNSFHETEQTSSEKESDCRLESEPSCSRWQQSQQMSPNLSSASTPNLSILTAKPPISWTASMNVVLCKTVEYVNPFKFKERTRERGQAWGEVASNLKRHGYEVTKRSVRDRYKILKGTVAKRNRNSKGLKEAVEDLVEVQKGTKEQQNGVQMRKWALKSFTETNKRIKSERDGPPRKSMNTVGDATNFLMRKLELDKEWKEREFQLKREEADQRQQDEERRREREEREEERRRDREEREEERRRRDEERRREKEDREEERRRHDEERRREKEDRDEERRRKEEADRERRMELLQEQLVQQNQLIMMMLKKQQNE